MEEKYQISEEQNSRLYYLALICSVIYLVRFVTLWEPYRDIAEISRYFAWLFCFFVFFSSISQYKTQQQLFVACMVLLSIWVGVNCDRLDFMFFTSTLIVGAKNIEFEKIIKVHFLFGLFFCLFNVIGNQMGFIEDASFLDQTERLEMVADSFLRQSYGYDWCSDFASHVFLIILSYWIVKKGVLNIFEITLLSGVSIFVLFMTGTRMAAGCILLVVLFSLYCRYRNPQKISRFVWYALILSVPFFVFISLYLTLKYNETDMDWMILDTIMSGRLHLGQEAIIEKGIPWLGQEYVLYGMGNSNGGIEYNYIDNAYIQYLVICGILATVTFIICYVRICYHAYLCKNLNLILAVFLSGFFGLITQFHFNIAYCPLLLATFATLGTGTDQSETNELMNCAND